MCFFIFKLFSKKGKFFQLEIEIVDAVVGNAEILVVVAVVGDP